MPLHLKKSTKKKIRSKITDFSAEIRRNKYRPGLFHHFDWFLFLLVIGISLFGVVAIFAATATAQTEEISGFLNILSANSTYYAGLQLLWMVIGVAAMAAFLVFDYHLFGTYSMLIYWLNLAVLALVLTVEAGRGGMSAFFNWSSSSSSLGERGFQPSEFGKVAMIIALAQNFSKRKEPIHNIKELLPSMGFVLVPVLLVLAQPDVGTAIVYLVIYALLLWVSGTDLKLIAGVLAVAVCALVPIWYYLNTASSSFRLTRILMWLNPSDYADDARQVINGQIAIGSGGLFGNGVTSLGSFASLGFIPDDHTDFCFAIVCEAFGFVGAVALIAAFTLFLLRLLRHAYKTEDVFGSYIVMGVFAMFLFHILENICMILGILPVTGIPLSFISYGGSNYLTSMMALGLVLNVVMRSGYNKQLGDNSYSRSF